MYCVKCGVKLPDSAEKCPLCGLPAWRPEGIAVTEEHPYPGEYPPMPRKARHAVCALITAILAAVALSCLIGCLKTYGHVRWSGYVMLGAALVYVSAVLPAWFDRPNPLVFVPVSFAAVCGYLLYICLYTGGHWFLPFAFPVTGLAGLLATGAVALYRYLPRHKLLITGGLIVAVGCSMMLLEFFAHITFQQPMFLWSLYPVTGCSLFGLFLILAGLIPPLREALERRFFL